MSKQYTSIFVESTEDRGLLYNSYKNVIIKAKSYIEKLKSFCDKMLKEPDKDISEKIDNAVDKFNDEIDFQVKPDPIDVRNLKEIRNKLNTANKLLNDFLNKLISVKNAVAFGRNPIQELIFRSPLYAKKMDIGLTEAINNNIRSIYYGIDYAEKALVDLMNLVDQDLNLITVVDVMYVKPGYYENTNTNESLEFFFESMDDEMNEMDDEFDKEFGSDDEDDEIESDDAEEDDEVLDALDNLDDENDEELIPTDDIRKPSNDHINPMREIENTKNGVNRKKLYIAFIEYAKSKNSKNTFGSIFDKDIFHNVYTFVPEDMRYFYRLANPMLCVIDDLTFFSVSELKQINIKNPSIDNELIFAATDKNVIFYSVTDGKVYLGDEKDGKLVAIEELAETFDLYIQGLIGNIDYLNGK